MNARLSQCGLAIALAALAFLATASAQASVTVLTGGDPADASDSVGYVSAGLTDYAYWITNASYDQSAYTYKGVTFQPFNIPNIGSTVTVGTATTFDGFMYPAGSYFGVTQTSSDDLLLHNITKFQSYAGPGNHGTETLTLGGLVHGVTYQVDVFSANNYGGSDYEFTMTGDSGALPTDHTTDARAASLAYDIRENVVADSSGNITVTVTDDGALGSDNATINAFSVTQLPEPASMTLLGVGSLFVITRRRRRRFHQRPVSPPALKGMAMNARLSQCVLVIALAVMALLATASARASITVLSGGDPGEGYAPGYIAVEAYHFTQTAAQTDDDPTNPYYPNPYTIQGVVFEPVPVTSPSQSFGTTPLTAMLTNAQYSGYPDGLGPSIGASANDIALRHIVTVADYPPGPNTQVMTTTLNGLVSGQSYQIDVFVEEVGAQEELFTFQGSGSPSSDLSDDLSSPVAGAYYDISEDVVANASGIIDFTLTTDGGGAPINPYYNAFSVTITPEPASMTLLAAGSLLLLRRRRA